MSLAGAVARAAFGASEAGASGAKASKPALHTITIEGLRFDPPDLTVQRGDRVAWVNKDLVPHTATAEAGAGAFASPEIAPNKTWTHVVGKAGEYPYRCTLHPTMKARLVVL